LAKIGMKEQTSQYIWAKAFREMAVCDVIKSIDNAISVLANRLNDLEPDDIVYTADLLQRLAEIVKDELQQRK